MPTAHSSTSAAARELPVSPVPGFLALPVNRLWILGTLTLIAMQNGGVALDHGLWWRMALCVLGLAIGVFALRGYFALQPNEARVLILFGNYRGTIRRNSLHWANPFYSRRGSSDAVARTLQDELQAEAIVSARQQIVKGAVDTVRLALRELDSDQVVKLGEKRRAAMPSNLLVVLCGNSDATPVINTGTLYG
jgi:hypothetical protein